MLFGKIVRHGLVLSIWLGFIGNKYIEDLLDGSRIGFVERYDGTGPGTIIEVALELEDGKLEI